MNLQQNLELCKPYILTTPSLMQVKNTELPDYLLLLEPNWYIMHHKAALKKLHKNEDAFLGIFEAICKYRNPKNGALVFPSVSEIAEHINRDKRTAQRWIAQAEKEGYIHVVDCTVYENGKPRYKSSRYYFTRLIFDPDDEFLRKEIQSYPPRKSKAAALRYLGKPFDFVEPTPLSNRTNHTPPHDNSVIITIPDSLSADEIIENTNKKTVEEPETVILDKLLSRQKKKKTAIEVLLKYKREIGACGMYSHNNFVKQWEEGTYDKEEFMARIETIASDPLMKFTTTSPMRLYFHNETTIPMRTELLKTIRKYCQWFKEADRVFDALVATESVRKWYKPRANNEKACIKNLMEEIGKTLAELTSGVYL